jgi:hypothetical protein
LQQVLVDATHRIVARAQQDGLLEARLAKRYICYLPEKRQASELYPRIRHARCTVERNTAPYMCRFVAEQIRQISAADVEISESAGHPTALVIAPTQFGRRVYQHLRDDGIPNVNFGGRTRTEIEILDGYRKLVPNKRSRLGWRLLLHATLLRGWEDMVRQALLDDIELSELIPEEFRQLHLEVVSLLRHVLADEPLTDDQQRRLDDATGLPMIAIRAHLGLDEEPPEDIVDGAPTVKVTTLSGAKGLQAEHVYVVGLNEQHSPRTNAAPTDDEVCRLLVALTCARKAARSFRATGSVRNNSGRASSCSGSRRSWRRWR